jgi:hypothetical protein
MNSTLTALPDGGMDPTDMMWPYPREGGMSPWGPVQTSTPAGPVAVIVTATFGGGVWLSRTGRQAMPGAILSPFGQGWWDDEAGAAVIATWLFAPVASGDAQADLMTLLRRRPDWLDAIAAPMGRPNAAQARKILLLWARFSVPEEPCFALFGRESDTGMVHGWIGKKLFVGIEPDGASHS